MGGGPGNSKTLAVSSPFLIWSSGGIALVGSGFLGSVKIISGKAGLNSCLFSGTIVSFLAPGFKVGVVGVIAGAVIFGGGSKTTVEPAGLWPFLSAAISSAMVLIL